MKYKIVKETKPALSTFGQYKARSVHDNTVENSQIEEETACRLGISRGAVVSVRTALWEVINEHLRRGDRVRLKDWGLLKLEIESDKVDQPEQFKARSHIRGVRLHFLPESSGGSPGLYKDLRFEQER